MKIEMHKAMKSIKAISDIRTNETVNVLINKGILFIDEKKRYKRVQLYIAKTSGVSWTIVLPLTR